MAPAGEAFACCLSWSNGEEATGYSTHRPWLAAVATGRESQHYDHQLFSGDPLACSPRVGRGIHTPEPDPGPERVMSSAAPGSDHRDQAQRQEQALHELASLNNQPYQERLAHLLKVDAATLDVARVSYWTRQASPEAIRCESLYLAAEQRFESGTVLSAADYPAYFEAVRTGRLLPAHDALADPRTAAFGPDYLKPLRIGALLDVPVYVRGQFVGVVCHEHVGAARVWRPDEQTFAVAIGQLVSLAQEADRREVIEGQLRESEERFRTIVESSPVPMMVLSYPDEVCLFANKSASELTGVDYDRVIGQKVPELYADPHQHRSLLADVAAFSRVDGRELQLRKAGGAFFWAVVSIRSLAIDGRAAMIVSFYDLSAQKTLEEKLRHSALHDSLTGLPNRRHFFDLLRQEISQARRRDYEFGVLFIDLDDFRKVNDTYGHEAGDELLVAAATRLKNALRATDSAARLGGDKFTAILPDLKMPGEATHLARQVSAAMNTPYLLSGRQLSCTATVGVVQADTTMREPRDVLREADTVMGKLRQGRPHSAGH
jgi:diguanylate cyclase (GGDEF)-like protein/PAS domain S-box-containing protein